MPLRSDNHRPASHWRANDGPTLNAGLVALLFFRDLGTLYFCDFSGGGGGVRTPYLPPLDPRMDSPFDHKILDWTTSLSCGGRSGEQHFQQTSC